MDSPQTLALLLATPAGVAVVGALLWWRVGNVEREVVSLREAKGQDQKIIAELRGSVQLMERLVTDLATSLLSRHRKGDRA